MTKEEAMIILDGFKNNPLFSDTHVQALDMAISALSENRGEWIPTSERLPEDGKFVLFCDIDDDIMVGYHVKGRPNTHFTQDGSFEDMKNVRAWQPLPEPYKAEKPETCKGCLEPCIMYEPDMRGCKKKVREVKNDSRRD